MGVNETLERNEARVFFDHDHLSDVLFTIGGGSLALFSSRSPDKGGPNEDAAGILATGPDSAVIAVADGVGDAPAGSRASATAIECVLHAVQQAMREEQDLRHSLLSGFDAANEQVLSLRVGAATTLTAVVIHGCEIRAFHVGDSFMLITGQRGKVKLQNHPAIARGLRGRIRAPRREGSDVSRRAPPHKQHGRNRGHAHRCRLAL